MSEAAQLKISERMEGKREPDKFDMREFVRMLNNEECRLRDFTIVGGMKLGQAVALAQYFDENGM